MGMRQLKKIYMDIQDGQDKEIHGIKIFILYILLVVDVTEAQAIHEELRMNEERLRVALSAASIIVFNRGH